MDNYVYFRTKPYRNLIIKIHPLAEFQRILEALNAVQFPFVNTKDEHISYAVLELVNNSIRAHRQHNEHLPILLSFHALDKGIRVKIQDRGRGFDIKGLPFPLNNSIENVDFSGDMFLKYRIEHDFKRFGMGICIVRQTFDQFAIRFYDGNHNEIEGTSDLCVGTIMEMFLKRSLNGTS